MRRLILVAIVACTACASESPSGRATSQKAETGQSAPRSETRNPPHNEESLEYKLAVVDRGGYVAPGDVAVARFRSLLSQLSSKYVEGAEQIADMSVAGQKLLREKGVSESIQNLMEGLNQVLDGPMGNQKYAEYLALYVQLRDSGKSHAAAVSTLRGALRELGVR